jgi:hypothetical protein
MKKKGNERKKKKKMLLFEEEIRSSLNRSAQLYIIPTQDIFSNNPHLPRL